MQERGHLIKKLQTLGKLILRLYNRPIQQTQIVREQIMEAPTVEARRRIADATRDVHESLHHHPYISHLTSDTLTDDMYQTILMAYKAFYGAAEARRSQLEIWPELTLQPSVTGLETDTAQNHSAIKEVDFSWVSNPLQALGMLYVLHGAGIGGRTIARHVAQTLPDASMQFLRNGINPERWKNLLSTLNEEAQSELSCSAVIDSARQTFEYFGSWVSDYCERHKPVR